MRMPVEAESNTPETARAVGELLLYVDLMPRPSATPLGVIKLKNRAMSRNEDLWSNKGCSHVLSSGRAQAVSRQHI